MAEAGSERARQARTPPLRPDMALPRWIEPQLSKLAAKAPTGAQWVHEIKFGYRMAARLENGRVRLLTRSGLDWTEKYPATAAAFAKLKVRTAYIDGELCGVRPDGVTAFELIQPASAVVGGGLIYFAFDLLELNGEDIARLPLLAIARSGWRQYSKNHLTAPKRSARRCARRTGLRMQWRSLSASWRVEAPYLEAP